MSWLDREGIFKARPVEWSVFKADSGAVAVSIEFEILEQYEGEGEWQDWREYETHVCRGNWWVIKKTGQVNQSAVDQLTECLDWDGSLKSVIGYPPDTVVQIQVEEDEYDGKVRYRAAWMNPEDHEPSGGGASEEEIKQMDKQFGSLLRAAAGAAKAASKREPVPAGGGDESTPVTDDDIPF